MIIICLYITIFYYISEADSVLPAKESTSQVQFVNVRFVAFICFSTWVNSFTDGPISHFITVMDI